MQPKQQVDDGGLAGAGRSLQHRNLARRNKQRNVFNRGPVFVCKRYMIESAPVVQRDVLRPAGTFSFARQFCRHLVHGVIGRLQFRTALQKSLQAPHDGYGLIGDNANHCDAGKCYFPHADSQKKAGADHHCYENVIAAVQALVRQDLKLDRLVECLKVRSEHGDERHRSCHRLDGFDIVQSIRDEGYQLTG